MIERKIHLGIVWVVDIRSGWYFHLKAFPTAMKKISKDVYGPDIDHPDVLQYVKSIS